MAKIVYQTLEGAQPDQLARPGVSTTGDQTDVAVITGADRALHLLVRTLKAGAGIAYDAPPTSRGIFVLEGELQVEEEVLSKDDGLIVEHGGSVAVTAVRDGTVLAEFINHAEAEPRDGGDVHILRKSAAPAHDNPARLANMRVYADSDCPTCEVWLHSVSFGVGGPGAAPHSHDQDEIIFVTRGEMLVGTVSVPAGTAVAIDKGTTYGFAIGEQGLEFLNFRARDPETVFKEPGGGRRVFMERDHFRALAK